MVKKVPEILGFVTTYKKIKRFHIFQGEQKSSELMWFSTTEETNRLPVERLAALTFIVLLS